jgi:hypothetical protein
MSLLSARNAHLSGLVFPYVLSSSFLASIHFQPLERVEVTLRHMENQTRGRLWPILIALLIGILVLLGPMGKSNRFAPSVFPVDAVRWLETNPQSGRMFNAFDWGGYILFHLWPEHKVFIESQTDVTGEVTRQYETIVTLQEGWEDLLQQHNIRWAILPPDWPLTHELIAQGWDAIYQDPVAVILVK